MTPTATSQGTEVHETPSTEADLNALLGGGEVESSTATEVEAEEPAEEQETPSESSSEESTEEAETEEATEEEAESESEEQAEEEAEEEESELSITEKDRDYSEAAYKKAAAHYAKTFKVPLDSINLNDPLTRGLLKEVLDRGEALKRQATREEPETKETEEGTEGKAEGAEQAPQKPTPQQIQAFIKNAHEVAKSRIIPEVSMAVATQFTKALWADEAPQLNQEQADGITTALSQAFWMQLEDALPAIYGAMRNGLGNDAVFGRVETMAVREAAFEHMDGLTDKATGKPLYPNLEQMVDNGAIQRAMKANPWIKNIVAGKGGSKVANYAAQIDAAYKIARGEQVNPETVNRAVETGKKQATERAKKIASGRVAPGKTKGEIGKGPSAGQQLITDIVSGGGNKFSAALARDGVTLKH